MDMFVVGYSWFGDFLMWDKVGCEFFVLVSNIFVLGLDGELYVIIGVVIDIIECKWVEDEMWWYFVIVELMGDVVYGVLFIGEIINWNCVV